MQRRRDRRLIAKRNMKICARYYYWTEEQRLRSDDAIRQVAKNFGGVEHRIELVRIKDGVRFYNDSIASSPSRTIAGLRSFPEKVILIAGGYDKHIPYDVLGPEICAHVKKLFLGGATGPQIRVHSPGMRDTGRGTSFRM